MVPSYLIFKANFQKNVVLILQLNHLLNGIAKGESWINISTCGSIRRGRRGFHSCWIAGKVGARNNLIYFLVVSSLKHGIWKSYLYPLNCKRDNKENWYNYSFFFAGQQLVRTIGKNKVLEWEGVSTYLEFTNHRKAVKFPIVFIFSYVGCYSPRVWALLLFLLGCEGHKPICSWNAEKIFHWGKSEGGGKERIWTYGRKICRTTSIRAPWKSHMHRFIPGLFCIISTFDYLNNFLKNSGLIYLCI